MEIQEEVQYKLNRLCGQEEGEALPTEVLREYILWNIGCSKLAKPMSDSDIIAIWRASNFMKEVPKEIRTVYEMVAAGDIEPDTKVYVRWRGKQKRKAYVKRAVPNTTEVIVNFDGDAEDRSIPTEDITLTL